MNSFKRLAVAIITLSIATITFCYLPKWKEDLKIIGGTNATEGEFPFILSLQMVPVFDSPYHYCGGSILNETHIITAGHCVIDRSLDQIQVVAGAYDVALENQGNIQRRSVKAVTLHPAFNATNLHYDIALLLLNQSLEFDSHVQPIPLPSVGFDYTGNCTMIGWGTLLPSGINILSTKHTASIPTNLTSQIIQKVNVTLVSSPSCQSIYELILEEFDTATMICAKGIKDEEDAGPCNGDLGGPLLCNGRNGASAVAGIMSWSLIPCGNPSYPAIYTNISTLMQMQ